MTGLALAFAASAAAAGTPAFDGGGVVAEVTDGATLRLDDGAMVRLVGIDAPTPPPGRGGRWPGVAEARAALQALALGKAVTLVYGGTRQDRYGRLLAQVYLGTEGAAGLWLQGALLSRGLARVHTAEDNRALAAEMLAAESRARAARRGIWAARAWRVRAPEEVGADADSFQLVEGVVRAAAAVRGRVYLNFGPDRHTDFTVLVPPPARRMFEQAGLDPAGWTGRRVRVRGWIMVRDGPLIELSHPEAIEFVEER